MIEDDREIRCQLAVIGSGIAGTAASIFALDRGLSVAQIGNTGSLAYTTGYFDLLGYLGGKAVSDPWAGLARLREDWPDHPLARIDAADVRAAFSRYTAFLSEAGIGYIPPGGRNRSALLPAGLSKPTLSMPKTMVAGVDALAAGAKTLIVDFDGLQGFSGKEFCANFADRWPGLKTVRLAFPEMEEGGEIFAEVMARALQVRATRGELAARINAVLADDIAAVGLPAILGIHEPDAVHAEMESLIGRPVFEIPTMPPAVPGVRLRELFEQVLPARGVSLVPQRKVDMLGFGAEGAELRFRDNFGAVIIHAEAVVLATGRFLAGGLAAGRDGIRETILDLPVTQPADREAWFREHYLDPRGHLINRCGIDVDDAFRPIGTDGTPVDNRLFAAGALLAHQDWVRQRCGAGIAIASAFKAVEKACDMLGAAESVDA